MGLVGGHTFTFPFFAYLIYQPLEPAHNNGRYSPKQYAVFFNGEYRVYEHYGQLKEVRPAGLNTVNPASKGTHREGGGYNDSVILFSTRSSGGSYYEFIDEDGDSVRVLWWEELKVMYAA